MPLYPVRYRRYGIMSASRCRRIFHVRNGAIIAAVYATNMAFIVIVVCGWKIVTNGSHHEQLKDVYYGVQVAYLAIIGTQIGLIGLSVVLMNGILKERVGMISPWVLGFILFMAVEALCTVYANVLRDQVNRPSIHSTPFNVMAAGIKGCNELRFEEQSESRKELV